MQIRRRYPKWILYGICLFFGIVARGRSLDSSLEPAEEARIEAFSQFAWGLLMEFEGDLAPREVEEFYLRALAAMPESQFILRQITTPWVEQGDYRRIAEALTPIARQHPNATDLQLITVAAMQALDRFEEAAELLGQAYHRQVPRSTRLLREYAALLWRMRRYSDLNQLLTRARRRPEFAASFVLEYATATFFDSLAQNPPATEFSQRRVKRFRERALHHARQAIAKLDREARFSDLERLFRILRESESWPLAESLLEAGRRHFPRHRLELDFMLVQILLEQERAEEAVATLDRLAPDLPLQFEAHSRAGRAYLELEQWQSAKTYLDHAFLQRPNDPQIRFLLAYANLRAGQSREAYEKLEPLGATNSYFLLLRAQAAAALERHRHALELSEQARELARTNQDEDFVDASFLLLQATLYERLDHDPEKMLELAEQAYAMEPDNPITQNFLGYTLADRDRQLERAERLILEAIQKMPESAAIRDSLAWVYYRQQRFAEALTEINRTLELMAQAGESDEIVLGHAGDIYLASGYPRLAVYYWRLAILRNSPEAERLRQSIEQVLSKIN